MSKPDFCTRTLYLQKLLREGRVVAAKQQAANWLREGYASAQFLALMADILDPSRLKRARRRLPPPQWSEIGEAFKALRDGGFIRKQAILILADRFHRSAQTIEKALAHYRSAEGGYAPAPSPTLEASGNGASK